MRVDNFHWATLFIECTAFIMIFSLGEIKKHIQISRKREWEKIECVEAVDEQKNDQRSLEPYSWCIWFTFNLTISLIWNKGRKTYKITLFWFIYVSFQEYSKTSIRNIRSLIIKLIFLPNFKILKTLDLLYFTKTGNPHAIWIYD